MPVNDKIRVPDYNTIRNKVANVLGTGSGNTGYGQTLRSSEVTESNRVTVNEWGNLRWDILNAFRHIYGSNPTTVIPQEGNTVRYDVDFAPSSDMALESPVTQYDTYANTLVSNRFTVHPSQSSTQAVTTISETWPGRYGTYWTGKIQSRFTINFDSANQARFFFNSGGEIRIASSRSGGSSTQQNTSWTSILSSAGTRAFGGALPSTGISPLNGQNFYRCTDVFQAWSTVSGSSPYGSNSYRLSARTPGVANNSTGTASSVEFLIEFIDNYVDPGNSGLGDTPNTIDSVDGTFTISISYLYATGVLEPVGAGDFVVQQPDFTIGSFEEPSNPTPPPIFSSTPLTIDEGSGASYTVVNLGAAGTYYWTILHGTTEAADFVATSGSFTTSTTNGPGTINLTTVADLSTEGNQTFQIQVRTGSTSGTVVATSTNITIVDTSTSPTFTLLVVGGGGGGGGQFFDGSVGSGGGGGGSGGFRSTTTTVTLGQTVNISVGAGGGGSGYNSNAVGGTGGTSSFGAISATGGTGGFSNFANPFAGTGGSPGGVNGSPGGFGSFNGGAGGNNGTGFGRGGNGGSNSAGLSGQAGVVRISYPGPRTLASITGLTSSYTFDGTTSTYTFTAGSGSIVI